MVVKDKDRQETRLKLSGQENGQGGGGNWKLLIFPISETGFKG
jgi:hypothetical protein